MSELEYFLSVENIEISLYAQARQLLLPSTQGNIYNRLRFLNKYLTFLEELNELFRENWSKFLTAGYLVRLEPSQHQIVPTVWRLGQTQNAYNKPSHVQAYRP